MFSPVTTSSRINFPPGLSTLASSAKVSKLWTAELSARTHEATQSKVDAEREAEGTRSHWNTHTHIFLGRTQKRETSKTRLTEQQSVDILHGHVAICADNRAELLCILSQGRWLRWLSPHQQHLFTCLDAKVCHRYLKKRHALLNGFHKSWCFLEFFFVCLFFFGRGWFKKRRFSKEKFSGSFGHKVQFVKDIKRFFNLRAQKTLSYHLVKC